jgi:lysophospholipase L1-like esterase
MNWFSETIVFAERDNAMNKRFSYGYALGVLLAVLIMSMPTAWAQYWVSFEDNTRYLALGDSLSAGYGAHPATNGFVYQLYQSGAIDNINNLLLDNIGVVNATSKDVLDHQLPLGALFFSDTGKEYRKVITLTIGGNDMTKILTGGDPTAVLTAFSANLYLILYNLTNDFPDAQIFVANQYNPLLSVPGFTEPELALLINTLNEAIEQTTLMFSQQVTMVDVFSAFEGRKGLLLIEKKDAAVDQVHPSNAGYQVITKAFADAIRAKNK